MCTDAFKDEDFVTNTIRKVDGYLAGERAEELRAASVGASADEWDTASMAEYDEWSREIGEQTDAYLDIICAQHGDERGANGLCPQCEAELLEERRCDM